MRISVRRASLGDVEWLVGELRSFARFAGYREDLFEEAHARAYISGLIEGHLVIVAEKPGVGLVGFIAGAVIPQHPLFPKIRVLSENFWWVSEGHRGSRAALMLLNAFEEWGLANVDMICMALEAVSPVNPRALEKRGYKLNEKSFTKAVA